MVDFDEGQEVGIDDIFIWIQPQYYICFFFGERQHT